MSRAEPSSRVILPNLSSPSEVNFASKRFKGALVRELKLDGVGSTDDIIGSEAPNKTCSSYPRSKLTGYSANKSSENPSVPQRRFAPALRHGETPVSPTPFHAFAAPRSRAAGY